MAECLAEGALCIKKQQGIKKITLRVKRHGASGMAGIG